MSWYYGGDTNTSSFPSCSSPPSYFYIGRLGGELSPEDGGFNFATAESVGPTVTFPYWNLGGPTLSSDSPDQWGDAQAQAFLQAWQSATFAPYVGGTTFFLDIEPHNGGWNGTTLQRQQTLIGALAYLSGVSNLIGEEAYPGIYISVDNWKALFGSDFVPNYPFVLWLAGTSNPDCSEAPSEFPANVSLGGYKTMVWQYYVSTSEDFDITPYEGYWLYHTWRPVSA